MLKKKGYRDNLCDSLLCYVMFCYGVMVMKKPEDVKYKYLSVRVNERMKSLIEKRSSDMKMTISEYVIHAVLVDSMIDGNIESVKIVAGNLKHKLRESAFKLAGSC